MDSTDPKKLALTALVYIKKDRNNQLEKHRRYCDVGQPISVDSGQGPVSEEDKDDTLAQATPHLPHLFDQIKAEIYNGIIKITKNKRNRQCTYHFAAGASGSHASDWSTKGSGLDGGSAVHCVSVWSIMTE